MHATELGVDRLAGAVAWWCHLTLFVQQQLVLRALLINQTLLLCKQLLVRRASKLLLFVLERTPLFLE